MLQQGSCFTLHPPGCDAINPEAYDVLRVPEGAKQTILVELRQAATNWATLFPDLDHLVEEIRTDLGLNP
jgi:hypothetical protein